MLTVSQEEVPGKTSPGLALRILGDLYPFCIWASDSVQLLIPYKYKRHAIPCVRSTRPLLSLIFLSRFPSAPSPPFFSPRHTQRCSRVLSGPIALGALAFLNPAINPSSSRKSRLLSIFFIFLSFVLHLLSQLRVVLLEPIAHALLRGHPFEHAAVDAAVFARRHGFGCEVVDARCEAVFDKATECL